jgi:hypothetical protein
MKQKDISQVGVWEKRQKDEGTKCMKIWKRKVRKLFYFGGKGMMIRWSRSGKEMLEKEEKEMRI